MIPANNKYVFVFEFEAVGGGGCMLSIKIA